MISECDDAILFEEMVENDIEALKELEQDMWDEV